MRIAAVGDVHVGADAPGFNVPDLEQLCTDCDVLLIAGDLTQHGHPEEGALLATELQRVSVPVVAVLGNHDYHQGQERAIRVQLERVGVTVLEGESTVVHVAGRRLGVAGAKGFGGGFLGACGSEFGEEEMKLFMRHSRSCAERLQRALVELVCDVKVALTHYSPVKDTLCGERPEIFPFLGSYFLAEAIDAARCAIAFHGHAHSGTEKGCTLAGVPVRNVARPVIKRAYRTYVVESEARAGTGAQQGVQAH